MQIECDEKKQIDCGPYIKHICDSFEKNANNNLKSCDLTFSQLGALLFLRKCENETASLKELEKCLHVSQPAALGIASRLEQKEFVESFLNPDDKRGKLVRLTQKGQECLEESDKHKDEAEKIILGVLSPEEQAQFRGLLKKISESLS